MAKSFYQVVVARGPLHIGSSTNALKPFAPYLSRRLMHRIEMSDLCEDDWLRKDRRRMRMASNRGQPPEPRKSPKSELALFSGSDEMAGPAQFHVERSELRRDGSTYVYVELQGAPQAYSPDLPKLPPEAPLRWEIALRVVWESGRPLVDDVIYLKGKEVGVVSRLTEDLRVGCRGSHWVADPG